MLGMGDEGNMGGMNMNFLSGNYAVCCRLKSLVNTAAEKDVLLSMRDKIKDLQVNKKKGNRQCLIYRFR